MAMPLGDLLHALRSRNEQTANSQLAYSPVYFTQEAIASAIDQFERLAITSTKLDPLQKLAVELLIADYRDSI